MFLYLMRKVKFWLMRKRKIELYLSKFNLKTWTEYPRFLEYLLNLPVLCINSPEDFTQAYYDYQMEDFDHRMWLHDFCIMSHIASYGPMFIYTYEGKFLRNEYSEEAVISAMKLFGSHIL